MERLRYMMMIVCVVNNLIMHFLSLLLCVCVCVCVCVCDISYLAATVGLESTSYMYDTGDSAVEVCVYISLPIPPTPIRGRRDCPITFPIDLIFHLSPVTAGIKVIKILCIILVTT